MSLIRQHTTRNRELINNIVKELVIDRFVDDVLNSITGYEFNNSKDYGFRFTVSIESSGEILIDEEIKPGTRAKYIPLPRYISKVRKVSIDDMDEYDGDDLIITRRSLNISSPGSIGVPTFILTSATGNSATLALASWTPGGSKLLVALCGGNKGATRSLTSVSSGHTLSTAWTGDIWDTISGVGSPSGRRALSAAWYAITAVSPGAATGTVTYNSTLVNRHCYIIEIDGHAASPIDTTNGQDSTNQISGTTIGPLSFVNSLTGGDRSLCHIANIDVASPGNTIAAGGNEVLGDSDIIGSDLGIYFGYGNLGNSADVDATGLNSEGASLGGCILDAASDPSGGSLIFKRNNIRLPELIQR